MNASLGPLGIGEWRAFTTSRAGSGGREKEKENENEKERE
jgi:hypothetical protein